MQLVRTGFVNKANVAVTSAIRKTSCSHGWLRLVVQCIFCSIIVSSFILIVIMSLRTNTPARPSYSRCSLYNCRLICADAPFYGEHEDDIIFAVSTAEIHCDRVFLTLNNPMFVNSTMPPKWLSRMRSNIHELAIVGGNLRRISPYAFMTQFTGNIRCLVLEDITIMTWETDMLVGLSSIQEICVKSCAILSVRTNALEAIDDTLNTLTITTSGRWNPTNLTGSSRLDSVSTVVLSSNDFGSILGRRSFTRIPSCRVLFLNSCRITAIGQGAFDHLPELQILHLNNNFLMTLPDGLFRNILANPVRPRISLQDNYWHCECSFHELQRLTDRDVFLGEPTCYFPENIRGLSFSGFVTMCRNNTGVIVRNIWDKDNDYVFSDGSCYNSSLSHGHRVTQIIAPVEFLKCTTTTITNFNLPVVTETFENDNHFLKPSFAIKSSKYSMVELTPSSPLTGYGLVWYQSECPTEIYCVNTLPNFLRVYNLNIDSLYTFCPLVLSSGEVCNDRCVSYSMESNAVSASAQGFKLMIYVGTSLSCLVFGALCLYAIIRRHPTLLKGSQRILFVKNKNVDAIVLPPKTSLRSEFQNDNPFPEFCDKDIFVLPSNNLSKILPAGHFDRSKSIRSAKSMAPSYISALQPTEDQLAEWRLKNLDNISLLTDMSFDVSSLGTEGHSIFPVIPNDKPIENFSL